MHSEKIKILVLTKAISNAGGNKKMITLYGNLASVSGENYPTRLCPLSL